jgi:hypothetical protein
MVGSIYKFDKMGSSASGIIHNIIGERLPLPVSPNGHKWFDSWKVITRDLRGCGKAVHDVFLLWIPEMSQKESDVEPE